MKIKNIFKKETKVAVAKVERLQKNQLAKVVGGGDETTRTRSGSTTLNSQSSST